MPRASATLIAGSLGRGSGSLDVRWQQLLRGMTASRPTGARAIEVGVAATTFGDQRSADATSRATPSCRTGPTAILRWRRVTPVRLRRAQRLRRMIARGRWPPVSTSGAASVVSIGSLLTPTLPGRGRELAPVREQHRRRRRLIILAVLAALVAHPSRRSGLGEAAHRRLRALRRGTPSRAGGPKTHWRWCRPSRRPHPPMTPEASPSRIPPTTTAGQEAATGTTTAARGTTTGTAKATGKAKAKTAEPPTAGDEVGCHPRIGWMPRASSSVGRASDF